MSRFKVLRNRQSRRRRTSRGPRRQAFRRVARLENLESRMLMSAKPLGNPMPVSTDHVETLETSAEYQWAPAVAMAEGGDYVVAWDGEDTVHNWGGGGITHYRDVYFRRYRADGTPKDDQQVRVTDGRYDQEHCDVAMDADGNFVLVWTEVNPPANPYTTVQDEDVFFRRFSAGGSPLGPATRVHPASTADQHYAKVAMADNGDFVVVWQDEVAFNDSDIRFRRFRADGTPLDAVAWSAAGTNINEHSADVAMDASGRFVITWAEIGGEVYYKLFAAAGYVTRGRTRVDASDDGQNAYSPAVAMNDYGEFTVAWRHRFSGGENDVHAQLYSSEGDPAGLGMSVSLSSGSQGSGDVAMSSNQIVFVYQDNDSSVDDVFTHRYRLVRDPSGTVEPRPLGWLSQPTERFGFFRQLRKNVPVVAMNDRNEFVLAMRCEPRVMALGDDPVTFIAAQKYVHDLQLPGLYDAGASEFHLRYSLSRGPADNDFDYGGAGCGWIPLAGDWDGDGNQTIGLYDPAGGNFHLKNINANPPGDRGADLVVRFGPNGNRGWLPIAGDWNGDGVDSVGLYDPVQGAFHLRSDPPWPNLVFRFGPNGNRGWLPLWGDWDGDGADTVGLYDPSASGFHLKNSNSASGGADEAFRYHRDSHGWIPLTGDWNQDGIDTVGLYDPQASDFHLRNTHSEGGDHVAFLYPDDADLLSDAPVEDRIPLVGDWVFGGDALRAADGEVADSDAAALTDAQLQPIIAEAIARWDAAGIEADFSSVEFVITDLPGTLLGLATLDTISIDHNAAGHGWFVDPTPGSDEEFSPAGPEGEQVAVDPRAVDRIDLMTVVSHELGHLLGLDDLDPSAGSLMSGTLERGVRREPGAAEIDALVGLL